MYVNYTLPCAMIPTTYTQGGYEEAPPPPPPPPRAQPRLPTTYTNFFCLCHLRKIIKFNPKIVRCFPALFIPLLFFLSSQYTNFNALYQCLYIVPTSVHCINVCAFHQCLCVASTSVHCINVCALHQCVCVASNVCIIVQSTYSFSILPARTKCSVS